MPKSLLSLLVALTLSLSFVPFAFAQDLTALTNSDILTMVRAKLPSALIVEKINTSNCNFDTFPSVLAELKHKGVTDEVLMAMVQAPHGIRKTSARNRISEDETNVVVTPINIPDGTDSGGKPAFRTAINQERPQAAPVTLPIGDCRLAIVKSGRKRLFLTAPNERPSQERMHS